MDNNLGKIFCAEVFSVKLSNGSTLAEYAEANPDIGRELLSSIQQEFKHQLKLGLTPTSASVGASIARDFEQALHDLSRILRALGTNEQASLVSSPYTTVKEKDTQSSS